MHKFDIAACVLLGLGLVRGLWVGARRQLVSAASWVAGLAAAWFGAAPLAHELEGPLGLSFAVAWSLSAVVLANVVGLVVRLVLNAATSDEGALPRLRIGDRLGGGLLGAAKSAVFLWLAFSSVALFDAGLQSLKASPAGSRVYAFARERNAWRLAFGPRIEQVGGALKKLAAGVAAPAGTLVDEVKADKRVEALLRPGSLREALEAGDVATLLRSDAAPSLLSDGEFLEKVEAALEAPPRN